ncbi:MAG: diguanylate cyclase, partial [Bacillota bacterium]|nr:diguanylate cyclase [Bacillota bacterium]
IPMLAPAAVNAALSLASIFNGHMFYLDAANIYYRGPLFPLMAVISLFYLVYAMILIVAKKHLLEKREFFTMLVFGIPPLVGGVVQSLVYGLSLVWICATFSALIIFINMQNNQLYTDHLTGLFNRRQLDSYLRQNSQAMENGMLAGVMIDLNSFKQINDQYGHNIGDQALQHTAEILTKTFRERDFVARYGGDEFLILMIIHDRKVLETAVQRLKENAQRFNDQSEAPYQISLSVGYDCRSLESEQAMNDFLKHIDQLMYEDKQRQLPA